MLTKPALVSLEAQASHEEVWLETQWCNVTITLDLSAAEGAVFLTASNTSSGTTLLLSTTIAADPIAVNISGYYLSPQCPSLCRMETIRHGGGARSTIIPLQAAVAVVHWSIANNTLSVNNISIRNITQPCHPVAAFAFYQHKPIFLCIVSSSGLSIHLYYITVLPNFVSISHESNRYYPQEYLSSYTVFYRRPCSFGVLATPGLALLTDQSTLIFISAALTFPYEEPLGCTPSHNIVYPGRGELFISCGVSLIKRYDICDQYGVDVPTERGQAFPFREWNPVLFVNAPNVTVEYAAGRADSHFTLPVFQQLWFGHGYRWQLQNMFMIILENGSVVNLDLETGRLSDVAIPPVNTSLTPQLLPSYDDTVYVGLLLTDGRYAIFHLGCGIALQHCNTVPDIIAVTGVGRNSCESSSPSPSTSTPPPPPSSSQGSPSTGFTTTPLNTDTPLNSSSFPPTNSATPASSQATIVVAVAVSVAAVTLVMLSTAVVLLMVWSKRKLESNCR